MLGGCSRSSSQVLWLPGLPLFAGFFFWHSRSQLWEGFLDRGPCGHCLKTRSSGPSGQCSLTQATAGSSGSSMELWGPCVLLCLFSLLTQVTAETPTPKAKKAANAKKGKEVGWGAGSSLLDWPSPSVLSFPSLLHEPSEHQ